jgi:hypothetical protein
VEELGYREENLSSLGLRHTAVRKYDRNTPESYRRETLALVV